jgi:fatty acid desaturase
MSADNLEQMRRQYTRLRDQYQAGRLSSQQFRAEVDRLRVQDERGYWWTVDADRGGLLFYNGREWMPASRSRSLRERGAGSQMPARRRRAVLLAVLLPLATAGVWFVWSALHLRSEGNLDCLTPLIMAGVPIALLFYEKPLERFLAPLQSYRDRLAKPVRMGMAFALPIVVSLLFTSTSYSGFGAIRISLIVSMLGVFALLHEPEVSHEHRG